MVGRQALRAHSTLLGRRSRRHRYSLRRLRALNLPRICFIVFLIVGVGVAVLLEPVIHTLDVERLLLVHMQRTSGFLLLMSMLPFESLHFTISLLDGARLLWRRASLISFILSTASSHLVV